MAWVVLILSGLFEAVWALALAKIEGFSRPVPIVVFLGGLLVSMGGLYWAMKSVPVGTGYAVWVGIGATATVIGAVLLGEETISLLKVLFIIGIIACVIGLKIAP